MDRRTKILAGLFGLVLVYALFSSVVYPQWLKPMFEIDKRIADRQQEYDRLADLEDRVDRGRAEYKSMVSRVGSFDPLKVQTEVRSHITELIKKHALQDQNVVPSRPTEDRKTGLTRMQITVSAMGKLSQVIGFLKDTAEMPHLVRVGNAAIYPAGAAKKGQSRDRVNLRVPLEILILPQNKTVGKLEEDELVRPEGLPPRHQGRDYASLWTRKPFREPIPLKANAGRDASKKQNLALRLTGTATGGEPPYKCMWSPSDTLKDPAQCKPEVITTTAGKRTYTLTITDDEGATVTDTVAVTIEAKPKSRPDPVVGGGPIRPTQPQLDKPWPEARRMKLAMTLLRKLGSENIGEVMIFNSKGKRSQYFAVGDDFNGGELLFVHPRGGIGRRNKDYFIYPVGGWLSDEVRAGDPHAELYYPELYEVAGQLKAAELKENPASSKDKPAAAKQTKVAPKKAPGRAAVKPAKTLTLPPKRTADLQKPVTTKPKTDQSKRVQKRKKVGPRMGLPAGKTGLGKQRAGRKPRTRKVRP